MLIIQFMTTPETLPAYLFALAPDSTRKDARAACETAKARRLPAVFVLPTWTADGADILEGSETILGSVIGFPHGNSSAATKAAEAATVVADGAMLVAMVVNISAVRSGADLIVIDEMQSVADACAPAGAAFGVILETSLLPPADVRRVAKIAHEMGADFLVTETGFAPSGARAFADVLADVRLLSDSVQETTILIYRAVPVQAEIAALLATGADGLAVPDADIFADAA